MKPPDRGWVILTVLLGWSFWMWSCGQGLSHANTRQGYDHGLRMCIEQIGELAAYKDAYSRGDSIAVPITDSTGVIMWVWHQKTGYRYWSDIRKPELP